MKLGFHGHACFELREEGWPTVIVDPYRPDGLNGRFNLPPIEADPQVIAITHFHEDHAWIPAQWKHVPVVDATSTFQDISFTTQMAYHDKHLGTRMGLTVSMSIEYAGLTVVHLGDMGACPSGETLENLRGADVLLLPVGDTYTMGPEEAAKTALALDAGWIVPMHGAHPNIDLPLKPASDFISVWPGKTKFPDSPIQWADLTERPPEPTVLFLSAPGS